MSKKVIQKETRKCGECKNVEPIYDFNTLTVHGQQPTLGKCPFSTTTCVILSQRACKQFK